MSPRGSLASLPGRRGAAARWGQESEASQSVERPWRIRPGSSLLTRSPCPSSPRERSGSPSRANHCLCSFWSLSYFMPMRGPRLPFQSEILNAYSKKITALSNTSPKQEEPVHHSRLPFIAPLESVEGHEPQHLLNARSGAPWVVGSTSRKLVAALGHQKRVVGRRGSNKAVRAPSVRIE